MQPAVFPHPPFPDYALLDSGAGEKLERFGEVTVRRPDPQALWGRRLETAAWDVADLVFVRDPESGGRSGRWQARQGAHPAARASRPEWSCRYGESTFLVRPTSFKHVGVFPEQAVNWDYVRAARQRLLQGPGSDAPPLLNLFGYSGAASVIAAQAGFEVTHVDASRTAIEWTRDNAERSGLGRQAMRVLCDDALAFVRREARRGVRYAGILLDPPHHGRGPKGETWQFEEGIAPLVAAAAEILAERAFLVLSTYAIGCSPLALANLLLVLEGGDVVAGELALPEEGRAGRRLPAGFCARWERGLAEAGNGA